MKRVWIACGLALLMTGLIHGQEAPQANDDISRATPVTLDSRIETAIVVNQYGSGTDQYFALDLDAAGGDARFDVVAATGPTDRVEIDYLTDKGDQIFAVYGDGEQRLKDYVLGAGRHFFRLRGSWDEGEQPPRVTLSFERKGTWQAGEEREPNGDFAHATAISIELSAKGVLADDSDRDIVAFESTAPARLWTIVATGDGMGALVLYDGAGNELKRVTRDPTLNDSQMWNVLLPPGLSYFEIGGDTGPWQIKATPNGPAPLEVLGGQAPARRTGEIDEVEPDNTPGQALILPFGAGRTGQIESNDDADIYRFSVEAETRMKLTLKGATGMRLRALVTRSENNNYEMARVTVPEGEAATGANADELLLPQGDYYVWVHGDRREAQSYELGLERLPYYSGVAGPEPNETLWDARPVPPSLVVDGAMSQDDVDLFRLPALAQPARLTLTMEEAPKGLQPRIDIIAETPHLNGPIDLASPSAGEMTADPDGKTYTLDLAADNHYVLRLNYGTPGPYRIRLAFAGGPQAIAPADTLRAALTLGNATAAAFSDDNQRIAARFTLTNTGGTAIDAALAFHPGDDRWIVEGAPATLHIEAGQSADANVTLVAPPQLFDGATTMLSAEARAGPGVASAEAGITAKTDAPPVAPEHRFELPDSLLGGIDVAWLAFGATASHDREQLIDGFASLGTAARLGASDAPEDVMQVTLPGDAPQTLLGITFNPTIGPVVADQVRRVAVEASSDGTKFARVFEGEIPSRQREYAFPFAAPVVAKYLRILPMEGQNGHYSSPTIGEFKAIADVAIAKSFAPNGFNLADPKLGGYLVAVHPIGHTAIRFLDEEDNADSVHIPADGPRLLDWTVAFRNQRAARLASITWTDVSDLAPEEAIGSIEIETAMELTGPWTKAGPWTLDRSGGAPAPFTFAQPIWARFVRFSVPVEPYNADAPTRYYRGPRQIQILEAPPDANGGTIIGEWGDTTREGPYERAHPQVPVADAADRSGGGTREAARILTPEQAAEGRASAGTGSQWWVLAVPEGGQSLVLTLTGHPALGVTATVTDDAGNTVPVTLGQDDGHIRIVTAKIAAGNYYIHVEEPPRSIAIVWDTSGSVSPYVTTIMQSVRGFVRFLTPGRDEVQLLAFGDPEAIPLMKDWTGDPTMAFGALSAYDWKANSSNGEGGIIGAAKTLSSRPGSRAIIIITDFQTGGGYDQRNEALDLLAKTGAQVFAVAIPSDSAAPDAAIERGLMRAFASASNGFGFYAGSPGLLEQVFSRTAATLRAPKDYTILANIGFKPPEPGFLDVKEAPANADPTAPVAVSKDRAVLVIFDASGSMLKKFGKSRRIEVAKETLSELTQSMLPQGTPFAMRVFGDTKKGSCDTNLRIPLAPLDRAVAKTAIDRLVSINGAKTAIAAAMHEAVSDLADAKGQELIILITDGEETCNGDPLKEIEALRASGIEARVSIVGFAVDDIGLKDTFSQWATAGGGGYFDASKPEEIAPAVHAALAPTYEVRSADGSVAAVGVVGAGPVKVPPGTYTLHIFVDPPEDYPITVESGGTVTVTQGQ